MRRKNILSLGTAGLILVMCAMVRQGVASSPPSATLRSISVSAPASSNDLQLRVDGIYSFKAMQATPDTIFIDLVPATADHVASKGEWSGGLFTGYRLSQFTDPMNQPVVRIAVEMKYHRAFQVQRTDQTLLFLFGDNSAATTPSSVLPSVSGAAPAETSKPSDSKIQPARTSGSLAEVSSVSINDGPDGEVFVDVATTQLTPYHVLQLNHPRRLVVDLDKARQALHQKTYAAQSPLLSEVRVGQFREKDPSIVRVVVDLSGDPTFDVHAQPGGIRIELKSHRAASHVTARAVPASTVSTPEVKKEEGSPQVAEETQTNKSSTDGAGDQSQKIQTSPIAVQNNPDKDRLSVTAHSEFQNALPPANGSNEVSASPLPPAPGQSPEALQSANAAKILTSTPDTKTEAAQGQTPGSLQQTPDQVRYTGDPISLNLKDVDLKDFFRLIHEISGLNILVDPNVTGTVTMVLDNVPWDQALDIVLKNSQLGKTLEGNVLRISRLETLTAQQEAATKLIAAREDAQPLVTRFITVNYANAKTLQAMLKLWTGGGALSKRGTAMVDDRTNTLIISDIAAQIPVIEQIVRRLDTKSKQVSIEAKVIVASNTFERDIQGALTNGIRNLSGSVLSGGSTGTGSSAKASIPASIPDPAGPTNVIGQTSASGFGSYVINNLGATYFISAAIAAAETKGIAKTISKPVIVTQNNVQGQVVQGVQVPIQTNINNTITVTYINAALTLTVTPQVTGDGNIFMIIKVENSSVGVIVPGVNPPINTQSATTQVLVPDGGTVIFGGVTINATAQDSTYVPLLGQIPVIGHLFKTSTRTANDSQLLFFVTPKVLPG